MKMRRLAVLLPTYVPPYSAKTTGLGARVQPWEEGQHSSARWEVWIQAVYGSDFAGVGDAVLDGADSEKKVDSVGVAGPDGADYGALGDGDGGGGPGKVVAPDRTDLGGVVDLGKFVGLGNSFDPGDVVEDGKVDFDKTGGDPEKVVVLDEIEDAGCKGAGCKSLDQSQRAAGWS